MNNKRIDLPENVMLKSRSGTLSDLEGPQVTDETAPQNPETNDLLLERLSKIADTVNPVIGEDYWKKRRESNILLRLNMAAQKLKEWQKAENKEVLPEELQENSQARDNGYTHKKDQMETSTAHPRSTWKRDPWTSQWNQ